MKNFVAKLRNNGDYLASVATSYVVLVGQVIVQIFLVPFYLQHFGKADFGYLMIVLSLLGMSIFGIGPLGGLVVRLLGKAAAERNWDAFQKQYGALKGLLVYLVPLVVGVLIFGIAIIETIGSAKGHAAPDGVLHVGVAAAAYATIQLDSMFETWSLAAVQRRSVANLLNLLTLACFVAMVVPWVEAGGGPAAVFWSLAAATLIARLGAYLIWSARGMSMRFRFPRHAAQQQLRELFGASMRGYLAYGAIFAVLQADIFILGALAGPATAADYTLIWKIPEIVVLAIGRLSEALQPTLVHAWVSSGDARVARYYRQGGLWLGLLSAAAGLAYATFGRWAVVLWVGTANAPDTGIGYVLAGGAIFFLGASRLVTNVSLVLGHMRPLIRLSLVELAAKWLGAAILLPYLGYLALLASVNAIFVLGIGWGYVRLGQRLTQASTGAGAEIERPSILPYNDEKRIAPTGSDHAE